MNKSKSLSSWSLCSRGLLRAAVDLDLVSITWDTAPKAFLAERAAAWRPCCSGWVFQEGPTLRLKLTTLRAASFGTVCRGSSGLRSRPRDGQLQVQHMVLLQLILVLERSPVHRGAHAEPPRSSLPGQKSVLFTRTPKLPHLPDLKDTF